MIPVQEIREAPHRLARPHELADGQQVIAIAAGTKRPAYATRRAATPTCWLEPGSLHLSRAALTHAVLDEVLPRAAVTCDGQRAFVAFADTRYRSTVLRLPRAGGPARLRQTIYVACDAAMVHEWLFVDGQRDRSQKPRIHDPEDC